MITSIHKLPLHAFIDACCDEDYSGLITEGEPTKEEIISTWNKLLEQYSDAIKDEGNRKYIIAYREYQQAKIKHDLVITYIEMLNNYYVPKWANDLNKMVGSTFDFKAALEKGKDEYRKLLSRCYNRNKGNLIQYQLAELKLEEVSKLLVSEDNKKPDRAYFTKVMVNLKKMEGYPIQPTISTYEFCVLVNNYKDYLSHLENQKKPNGRR